MGFVISQIYPNDHRGIKQVKALLEKEGITWIKIWIIHAVYMMMTIILLQQEAALEIPYVVLQSAKIIREKDC